MRDGVGFHVLAHVRHNAPGRPQLDEAITELEMRAEDPLGERGVILSQVERATGKDLGGYGWLHVRGMWIPPRPAERIVPFLRLLDAGDRKRWPKR